MWWFNVGITMAGVRVSGFGGMIVKMVFIYEVELEPFS